MQYRDPQGPDAPDTEEFEAFLYMAFAKEDLELINYLLGARYFGMRLVPDDHCGRRLENIPPDFISQYQKVFMKHVGFIKECLQSIARASDG